MLLRNILLSQSVFNRTKNIHKKLNEIYEEETQKAQTLLKIFFEEKRNRGRFTYKINANANKPFAKQSIKNAITFVSTIKKTNMKLLHKKWKLRLI